MVLLSGNWLKTEEVENGDRIIFQTEGDWIKSTRWTYEDGTPKMDFVITVLWKGTDKSMRLNKTNRDIMTEAYGNETAEWVHKEVVLQKEKVMVGGKKMDMLIVVIPDAGTETPKAEKPKEGEEIPF